MKQLLFALLILFASRLFGQDGSASDKRYFRLPAKVSSKDYVPNTLIVKFKRVAAGGGAFVVSPMLVQSLKIKSASINQIKQLFEKTNFSTGSPKPLVDTKFGLDAIVEIKYSSSVGIEQIANEVLANSNVEYAEPRYIYHANVIPSDPFFTNFQSYLEQVKAPEAWDIPIGSSSPVLIAIVDSGSQLNHSDLSANIAHNEADPINGTDDDQDGYMDNYNGWDFVGANLFSPQGDNDPNVINANNAHGVHVSGLVSAMTNNAVGIASIAFNHAKLLIVKVGADDDARAISHGYEGIKYAADHGAKVISCSWGGGASGSFGQDIINYAIARDCLIVAAAGNDDASQSDYPAAYPGVMSVASVSSSDQKSYFSNYGSEVSISAPGESILSTYYNNTYAYLSGTSMATPIVSSAAALVKAKFPTLTMKEVADQLRITSDNIDLVNTNYTGLLGQGRLNVYNALAKPPTIRIQKITLQDQGDGSIPPGETFNVFFDLKNFAASITGLTVRLSSADANVTVSNDSVIINSIDSLETKTMVGPFPVYVKSNTPDNQHVLFNLNCMSGSSSSTESFRLSVSHDYIDIHANRIATSITGNGRVGYSDSGRTLGQGFVYNGSSMLYESSLMIGNSSTRVSNNARSGSDGSYDEHFMKRVHVKKVANQKAAFEGRSEFDDSGNTNPLNIYVKHSQIAYAAAPDDKYTIVKYQVKNTGPSQLDGLYIGLFTDFDVSNNGTTDITSYDATNRMGYIYGQAGGSPYAGVKLLSKDAQSAYYPLSYYVSGGPLQMDGSFSIAGKYETLSSGIKSSGLGQGSASGYDVSFVLGQGPYSIPVNDSVEVAFAFIGGDSLDDIQSSASAAQQQYSQSPTIPIQPIISSNVELKDAYPNPSDGYSNLDFSLPAPGQTSIILYSILGKPVKEVLNENLQSGWHHFRVDLSDLEAGIYFYRMHYGNTERSLKVQVGR